jgi:sulfur relay (sulfurtransferase) DsrC/TusE family protein
MITNFLNKDNVKILWDVISDEDIIKNQSGEFKENIFNLFTSNIKGFYDVESKKATNLVELNKKYIMLVLNHSNKVIKNSMSTEIKKIKISNETPNNVNELITYEEIQNDKRSQFDKDLNKRQEEFTNSMSLPVPPVPKFTDSLDDGPISEMEKAIQEITAKRNYDVEQINRNNNNLIANSNVDNWLKSQETSVKTDKFVQPIQNNNGNKLKYIKIDNSELDNSIYQNQVIDLGNKEQESPKKNVTWGKNEFYNKNEANGIKLEMEEIEKDNDNDNDNDNNIFKLFKKIPSKQETTEEKISVLQQDVKNLNNKIDMIFELLKNNNK